MRFKIMKQGGYGTTGISPAGGNLTGPLVLIGNPTQALQASTKGYVDTALSNLNGASLTSGLLPIARLPAYTGDITNVAGSNVFTLSNSGITPGTYPKVAVNAKGRITNGYLLAETDLPAVSWDKITTDKPSTLAGYGITDGITPNGGTMTGPLVMNNAPTAALHIATKAYIDSLSAANATGGMKVGDIVRKATVTTPAGFLRCNGGEVSKTTYSALFDVLKETYPVRATLSSPSYAAIGAGQPWKNQFDFKSLPSTASPYLTWTNVTQLQADFIDGFVVVTKNRVYLLGGNSESTTIYSATVTNEGFIGAFSAAGNLPYSMYRCAGFVTKNRVYLVGGNGSAGGLPAMALVVTAPINADGTLGTWTLGTSMPDSVVSGEAVVTKNRVYIFNGGYSSHFTAPINADGTVGAWSTFVANGISNGTVFVTKNRVYTIGDSASAYYYYPINADGTLGAAVQVTTNLPLFAQQYASTVVTKNRVWLIAGANSSGNRIGTTTSAPIDANGVVGAWSAEQALPIGIAHVHAVMVKDYMYVIGGSLAGTSNSRDWYRAEIKGDHGINDYTMFYNGSINKFDGNDITGEIIVQNDFPDAPTHQPGAGRPWQNQYHINTSQAADLGAWTNSGSAPYYTYQATCFVTKNRVYLCGGASSDTGGMGTNVPTAKVYSAALNSSGVITGGWTAGPDLPFGIEYITNASFVTKNRVYILGGHNAASNPLASMFTAPINADGTIGAWTTISGLPFNGYGITVAVTKNRVHMLGGNFSGPSYNAPINADGTVGTWTQSPTTPSALVDGEMIHSQCIVTDKRVYMMGGYSSEATAATAILSAPIDSNGNIGTWSRVGTLPAEFASGGMAYATAKRVWIFDAREGYTAPIDASGVIGAWATVASLPPNISGTSLFATSSRLYMLGGYAGNGSTAGIVRDIYYTTLTGGLNDYSPYYDGTITATDGGNFRLPDMTAKELPGSYTYIKI